MRRQLLAMTLASAASLCAQTFVNPVLPHGADPSVVQWKGSFLSVQGCAQTGRPAICLRMAKTLPELGKQKQTVVWNAPAQGPNAQAVWAPQVDVLGGELYIYYAAEAHDDANGDNDHRLFALVPQDHAQPLGTWVEAQTGAPSGQLVTDWKSVWAIDPDVFTASDGKLYLLYACRQDNSGTPFGRSQSICMARMRDPLHLDVDPRTGKSVVELSQPRQTWERRGWPTQEGPFGFTHDGVDYILYSASFSGNPDQYAEAMLVNDHPPSPEGWDGMLNPAAWRKVGPIFDGHHAAYGTASSVLVPSQDGATLWHVYHGTDCMLGCERVHGLTWRDRSDRAQPAGWSHGELVLGYPVDFANTDRSGRDVPVDARPINWPAWGAAFGDAAEGNPGEGRMLGDWKREGDAISGGGDGVAQSFYASNPNRQQYVVSARLKKLEGAGSFGVYAAFVDHANFVRVFFDGASVATDAVVNGKGQGARSCALAAFDPGAEHHLAVLVIDGFFRVMVDDALVSGACQSQQFVLSAGQVEANGSNGQAGIWTENARARFAAFHVIDGAPTDSRKAGQAFALRNRGSALNLDNACAGGCGGKAKTEAAVIANPPAAPYPATISSTQLWQLRENADGTWALQSVLSGACVEGRSEQAVQEACARAPAQAWRILPSGEGFALVNKASGMALAADRKRVVLQPRADAAAQRWMLIMQ